MSKFKDREVSCKSSLVALLAYNAHTNISSLDHPHIIATIPDSQYCLLGLPKLFDALSQSPLLLRRASATNYSWHLHSSFIKIFNSLL